MFLDQSPADKAVTKDDHVAMYDLHYSKLREIFSKKKKLNGCLQLLASFHSTWENFTHYITPASLEATVSAFQNDLKRVFDKVMTIPNHCDCGKDFTSPDYIFPKYLVKLPFKFDGCLTAIINAKSPIYLDSFIANLDILNKDLFSFQLSPVAYDYCPMKFCAEVSNHEPEEIIENLNEYITDEAYSNGNAYTKFYQNYQKYEDLRYTRDLRQFSSTVVDPGSIFEGMNGFINILYNFYNKVFTTCSDHLISIQNWAILDNPGSICEVALPEKEEENPNGATGMQQSTRERGFLKSDNRFFKPNVINAQLLHCMKDEVSTCWLIAQMLMFSKLTMQQL